MKTVETSRYKTQLQEMRSRLLEEIRRLEDSVNEDIKAPGDSSDVPTHNADRDSEGVDVKIALERKDRVRKN